MSEGGEKDQISPTVVSPPPGNTIAKRTSESTVLSLLWSTVKKAATVGIVYFVGYMNWSVAWLICPMIFSVMRDQWRSEKDLKRNIAKAAAMASEKEVILARVDDLPAWVFFPDVDRAEWLNRILRQLWPNVNHYANDLIKDVIEPNVRTALASYKLNGFYFDRIILGTIPPRIGGIKVYDKNVSRNEIIMDIDLFYAGDCDISFFLNGIKGGIKDFQIHGMVRVVMKPLITKIPLVGGLQVFFLNNPTIDFDLVGAIDVLDMPGLSDMLRRIIVEQVAAMMVLPNKLPITLSDSIDAGILKIPQAEGVLRIHVVEAKHLMKKDIGMLGKGKSDPYVVLTLGAHVFRTKAIDNTVNPKWDHWCETTVMAARNQSLYIHVWDKDDGPRDDESLGRAVVDLERVLRAGELDTWITLEQAKHGMIHLRLKWFGLSDNYADLKETLQEIQDLHVSNLSTALLTVYLDSAKNLPQARTKSKPDPYVIITVGNHSEQTEVRMRNDSPIWEKGMIFLVENPEADSIQFKIMDQKTGTNLGEFVYKLALLRDQTEIGVEKQPFTLQKSGPDSKIVFSLTMKILKFTPPPIESSDNNSEQQSNVSQFERTDSTKSSSSSVFTVPPSTFHKQDSMSTISFHGVNDENKQSVSENFTEEIIQDIESSKKSTSSSPSPTLRHRNTIETVSDAGVSKLGKIQLTLRYSVQRQKLIVVVHKVTNLPLRDPSNIPDPYVKLYLLPSRSKDTKRKTSVVKDNCNPVFDESFEYVISEAELKSQNLEVTVVTQKSIFSSGNNIMGQVLIDLGKSDITQAYTAWFDLHPEYSSGSRE